MIKGWTSPRIASCFMAWASVCSSVQVQAEDYALEQYSSIAQKIYERFSPAEYRYVGVGTSPTYVLAFLQEWGFEATQLPFSGASKWFLAIERDPRYREYLWNHFDSFLPKNSDKKILLIDFSKKGTLLELQKFIDTFFAGKLETEALILSLARHKMASFPELPDKNWIELSGDLPSVYDDLSDNDYDRLAEWGRLEVVDVQGPYKEPSRNQAYESVLEEVRSFLKSKPTSCSSFFKELL